MQVCLGPLSADRGRRSSVLVQRLSTITPTGELLDRRDPRRVRVPDGSGEAGTPFRQHAARDLLCPRCYGAESSGFLPGCVWNPRRWRCRQSAWGSRQEAGHKGKDRTPRHPAGGNGDQPLPADREEHPRRVRLGRPKRP